MNHQQIIDWQLNQLQQASNESMPAEMQAYLADHPDLQAELETMVLFWQSPSELPQPSSTMRARFYQSLANIEQKSSASVTSVNAHQPQTTQPRRRAFQNTWLQAAMLGAVFVMGIYTGQWQDQDDSSKALSALQTEVASLSTVMAISMLQHDSASQRLAAVAYTKQADLADPMLLDTLLSALSNERSTAVKLAIVDVLNAKPGITHIESQLVELALSEPQPLVQMALSRLLIESGSTTAKQQLIHQLQVQPVDQDVQEFLTLINAQGRI
jgi:hypothetical protein